VVEATDAEKRVRDEVAHEAWGDRLTVGQFVDREVQLRRTAFARQAMRTWLLIEDGDLERRPMASLETYEVRCRHGLRPGRAFQLASVYTAAPMRGLGYASKLVQAITFKLGQVRGAQAITLYSEVGPALYERCGYEARPAFEWRIPAARDPAQRVARVDGDAAVAAVLEARPPRGRFAILPSFEHIEWHRARERIYADALGRPIVQHGVLACDGGYALIAGDLKNESLLVLAWWADNAATAARLGAAAADEAACAGLARVIAWATPPAAEDADEPFAAALPWLGGECVPRDSSLPMLRALPGAPGLVSTAWRDIQRARWG
jgi:hypothetical protein